MIDDKDDEKTKTRFASLNGNEQFAISSTRGRRQTQEDTYVIETELKPLGDSSKRQNILPDHALFAVFDGHGTSFASEYVAEHFVSTFCSQKSFVEYSNRIIGEFSSKAARKNVTPTPDDSNRDIELLRNALTETMLALDAKLLEEVANKDITRNEVAIEGAFNVSDSGTTALIVILTQTHIVCANLGDSRAILQRSEARNNTTICLSRDHKPYNEVENDRICKAGGVVLGGKIDARLAVSRCLGDFDFKHKPSILAAASFIDNHSNSPMADGYVKPDDQMVSPIPDITIVTRDFENDKFLILSSDGMWDVLSNEKCTHLINTIFEEGEQSVALICKELIDQCYTKGSLDNMTVLLIKFPSQDIGYGGGVMKRRKQRKNKHMYCK